MNASLPACAESLALRQCQPALWQSHTQEIAKYDGDKHDFYRYLTDGPTKLTLKVKMVIALLSATPL